MTPDPHTVAEDTPLEEIVQLMEKKHIKRVPVMRGKKLVGIISRANLLHALASMAPTATAQAPNDHAIRERLLAELEGEKWAPVGALDIIVRDGVVELWGSITDERERKALIVAAENIPGVKAVRDHLVWVDTMTDMVFNPPNEAKAS
jgi:CBS domain-containing protein